MAHHRTKNRFRPRLDCLERRECPAVDVVQRGAFLYLTGDAADDWVAVSDEGGQTVEVQTIEATTLYRGVKWVFGNLGEGSDTFEFHQAGATNPSNSLVVKVDLAAGNDEFLYRVPGPTDQPPPVEWPAMYVLDVRAGTGDDTMTVDPEYSAGLDLDLRFDLGAGNDQFDASYKRNPATPIGAIMPCYSLDIESGEGDDRVAVAIGDPNHLEALTLEDVEIGVHGGGGEDSGIIIICDVAVTGGVTETVDLGAGANAASLTLDDVTVDGQLKQSVTGGDGGDEVGIIIIGGRIGTASQKVNLGAGADEVGLIIEGGVVGSLLQSADVGGGADEVGIVVVGGLVADVAQKVNTGDGEDTVGIIIEGGVVGSLLQSVDAGGGADEVGFVVIGGQVGSVAQKANLGDGDDIVSFSWKKSEALGPVMTRASLGEGHDQGVITVEAGTHFADSFAVTMDTGGGDDCASVMLQDSEDFTAFGGALSLRLLLGDGDDTGNVVIRDANDVAGPLTVVVDAGAGDDGIVADVDFTPRVGTAQIDPGNAPASVLVDLRGGAGLDTIDAYAEGKWEGIARFRLGGAAGDDAIGFHGRIADGSAGTLAVDVSGGAGDDVMAADLFMGPQPHLAPVRVRLLGGLGADVLSANFLGGPDTAPAAGLFLLDGGPGSDLAHAPAWAVVRNCEGRF